MMDKQDESESLAGLSSKRRAILPGLVLSNEQLTFFLADDGVRAAIARPEKSSTVDERERFSTVSNIKLLAGTSAVEAVQSTVAVPPISARNLKGTGIYSVPVPPQSAKNMLCWASTTLNFCKTLPKKLEIVLTLSFSTEFRNETILETNTSNLEHEFPQQNISKHLKIKSDTNFQNNILLFNIIISNVVS